MVVSAIFPNRARRPSWIAEVYRLVVRCANRVHRPTFPVLLLVAIMVCTWQESQSFAAAAYYSDRLVADSAAPSSGVAADSSTALRERTSPPPSFDAGSLRGPGRCATLRKRYAQSEACFARYRMKRRGLRPGAFQHCKQLKDPSWECGSVVVP